MALNTPYATAAEYRKVIGKTDTGADTQITADLTAISEMLNGRMGRFFGKDDQPVTRVYVPIVTGQELYVDDLVSVDELKIGDTVVSNYDLLPYNAAVEPEPAPYTKIRLAHAVFPAGRKVSVTGIFGWPAVPPAVKAAVIHLTGILRIESPRATRRISELGDLVEASLEAVSIVRQLTDKYKRERYV